VWTAVAFNTDAGGFGTGFLPLPAVPYTILQCVAAGYYKFEGAVRMNSGGTGFLGLRVQVVSSGTIVGTQLHLYSAGVTWGADTIIQVVTGVVPVGINENVSLEAFSQAAANSIGVLPAGSTNLQFFSALRVG
jgi:hypothetical protein